MKVKCWYCEMKKIDCQRKYVSKV
ncbi:hypothetical protein Bhyg_13074 [Pseudolycoriella hygida]|uniref:Uncharacterized protein n=1 Tax=Pseudolycoriella hygida TaxID=35572 RepID=A0A9Q0MZM0_9DIPT|nr:hypothetical protein Bhyg_13074 [Pseudolycoriella hygida]